jgi:hypothetical protein
MSFGDAGAPSRPSKASSKPSISDIIVENKYNSSVEKVRDPESSVQTPFKDNKNDTSAYDESSSKKMMNSLLAHQSMSTSKIVSRIENHMEGLKKIEKEGKE